MGNFSKDEELVDQYVRQNDKESAVKLVFDLIVRYARKKNFVKAEALREKLFELDPMSLTEIIKSAEIIEEEKNGSIDHDHLDIWSALYDSLTTEEAHTLYLALKNGVYDTDDPIFRQGELNPYLYFINHGQLKVFYSKEGREILLETLAPGDIAGEDTFFSITVCTKSLTTLSRAKLSFLEKDIFAKWQKEFPTLSGKLNDYCLMLSKPVDLFNEEGMDRRSYKRLRISGKLMFQILNRSGNPIGKAYKGNISDISVGGLSFDIKTTKKNALLLLARSLNVKFILPRSKSRIQIERNGMIIGVTGNHLNGSYTIHMKFDKMLSEIEEGKEEWLKTKI